MKYRIEIIELKNGRNLFKPQVYVEEVKASWFGIKKIVTRWENIIMGTPSNPTYETTTTTAESWYIIEEALEVIEGHKEKIRIENGEQPNNVTYKMID
jgi:hypothetical protein